MTSVPLSDVGQEIRFDRKKHACYLGAERLPAVGSILRKAAEALNPWAREEKTPEAMARMERGKTLHETLELYDLGKLEQADPSCEPYLAGLRALKDHLKIEKWDLVEEWVASADARYWGILDRAHSSCGVIELKTGTARPSSYRLAVAGYCKLLDTRKGSVVYLPAEGDFNPERDIESVTDADFLAFEMALSLSRRSS